MNPWPQHMQKLSLLVFCVDTDIGCYHDKLFLTRALTTSAWCLQARAHVLLKAKETELRVARETGAASETHQAELAAAKAALAEAHAAAEAVRCC